MAFLGCYEDKQQNSKKPTPKKGTDKPEEVLVPLKILVPHLQTPFAQFLIKNTKKKLVYVFF